MDQIFCKPKFAIIDPWEERNKKDEFWFSGVISTSILLDEKPEFLFATRVTLFPSLGVAAVIQQGFQYKKDKV